MDKKRVASIELTRDLKYFRKFWSNDINERLEDQTNLYSVGKTTESIKTAKEEMERFIRV